MRRQILTARTSEMTFRLLGHVPVHLIDIDRFPTKRVLPLIKHLQQGKSVPPIRLVKINGGRFRILDGRHRYAAHALLNRHTIFARWADSIRT